MGPEDSQDARLETWATALEEACQGLGGGDLSVSLEASWKDDTSPVTARLNITPPAYSIRLTNANPPTFPQVTPLALFMAEHHEGQWADVPPLLVQRWKVAQTVEGEESRDMHFIYSASMSPKAARFALQFLLDCDPGHRARHRARQLESHLPLLLTEADSEDSGRQRF